MAQKAQQDPNGPFMYKGQYHLFYQHLSEGCEWAFGLVWGHAVSADLIHWEHLPHAMVPTAKSLDADGCFSGCATIDTDGTPILLYTGVRLRTNPDAQPPPPPECDLNLPFIESQLYALPADPDDPLLVDWVKEEAPFIGVPPPNMNLTGWRDPFVVERPCSANNYEWVVLMGSGIKEVGGATIVYRTRSLKDEASWRYDGLLCVGDGDTGAVWECPLIAQLNPLPAGALPLGSSNHARLAMGNRKHSLSHLNTNSSSGSLTIAADGPLQQHGEKQQQEDTANSSSRRSYDAVSMGADCSSSGAAGHGSSSYTGSNGNSSSNSSAPPHALVNAWGGPPPGFNMASAVAGSWDERYTHFYSISPDACTNPTIYWLGRYHNGRFDLDNAKGPLRLDLGDTLYAPNVMRDDAGRVVLWGWLQERRTVGTYDYAGCMTVPRLLHLDGDRLMQCPAPELLSLRQGEAWQASHVQLGGPQASLPVPGLVSSRCLDIEAVFSQGSASTIGVLLRSWHQGGEGGAAVLYNWESGLLEVVFEALDPATMSFSLTAPMARRIGGPLQQKPGQPLALRLLLDASCLEIFTGSGEVLSTRIYRGSPPHGHADAGIEFVALDGDARLDRVAAYEMSSCIAAPHKRQWQPQLQQQAAAAAAAAGAQDLFDELAALHQQQQDEQSSLISLLSSADQQQLAQEGGPGLSPTLSNSLKRQQSMMQQQQQQQQQQLLLSPRAGDVAAKLQQLAFAGAGLAGGLDGEQPLLHVEHVAVPEEELCADIFNFE
ncbi:hypothetical protein COO60DRAFT_1107801 [Scenedesmus sp. NREL 46B-D3]|nr:hypothetical protein COO60DRAFT_1107801 [Scenedesmus sp. NREL 46B-D3]